MAVQNPFSTRAGDSVFNAAASAPKPVGQQATQITPTADSKVSDQLNNLLDENSRYIQSARGRANQATNARGLINSSIGVGAGESAAINAALPIAQQDAQTSFSAQQLNQNADNTFKLDDNKFQQQVYLQGADANFANAAAENQFGRTLDLQNNQQGFQGEQAGLDRTQQLGIINSQLQSQKDLQTQSEQFQGTQSAAERAQREKLLTTELAANQASQQATIASNEKIATQDSQLRQALLNTQISSEKDLANLQAELTKQNAAYNAQIQDQQSLLELTRGRNVDLQKSYLNIGSNFLTNAAAIYQDANIPAEAKQNLINSLKLEMQALFDLGGVLEAEPVLGAGQGGL